MPPEASSSLLARIPIRGRVAFEPRGVCRCCVCSSGQLTKMNAPLRREATCTACATASLPAPGGPIRSSGSARAASRRRRLEAREPPRCRRGAGRRRGCARRSGDPPRRAARARAPPFAPRPALRATRSSPAAASAVAPALFVELRVADRAGDLVGDDRDKAAVVLVEGLPHRTLDREHADQLIADEQRNGESGSPRSADQEPARRRRAPHHGRPSSSAGVAPPRTRAAVRGCSLQHPAPLRDNADDARADPDASADRLVLVAAARDDDAACRRQARAAG